MSCPYCRDDSEIEALKVINLELVKMLGAFVGSNIMFKTIVSEPVDARQAKDMEHHVSRATAAAAIRRLEDMVQSRSDLHRLLTRYRFQVGPVRYADIEGGPRV